MIIRKAFCPRGTVVSVVVADRSFGDAVVTGRIVVEGKPYFRLYHIESSGHIDLGYLPMEALRWYALTTQVTIVSSRLIGHWLMVVGDMMPLWKLDGAACINCAMYLDVSCVDLATDELCTRIVPACGTYFTVV